MRYFTIVRPKANRIGTFGGNATIIFFCHYKVYHFHRLLHLIFMTTLQTGQRQHHSKNTHEENENQGLKGPCLKSLDC